MCIRDRYLINIEIGKFQEFEQRLINLERYKNEICQPHISEDQRLEFEHAIKESENWIQTFSSNKIEFSGPINSITQKINNGSFILSYFDSKRHTNLNIPKGINKIELKKKYNSGEKANVNFIQYIVNLKADRSFARDENEMETVNKIDNWFENLESRLKSILNVSTLELRFDRKNYNFDILVDKGEPFNFHTLSDGFSAILSIVTELLLRMEAHEVKSYDLEGIVIIDEIETHLHVDLQKKILPFLTDFFPKIQFIVSTHSPFVLSSLSNATICDLETRTITSDLSGYSYDALIESYFKVDKYSEEVKSKIFEFESLASLQERTAEQNDNFRYLKNYFAHAPKYLSTELLVKLQQIELRELNNKK